MRTLTAGETTVLSSLEYSVYVRVSVYNADSSWIDLSDLDDTNWQISADITHNLDSPTTATVNLMRTFYDYSLSPLHEDSKHNQVSTGYSPLLKLGAYLKIETATIAVDTDPVAGDWKEVFRGIIDQVDFGGNITVSCRDLSGKLQDTFLEVATDYGDDAGTTDSEAVIQDVLDDAGTGVTLWTPYASNFAIKLYKQECDSVYNIIQNIAQQRGWVCRYCYDEDTSAWRLKYYEPDRTRSDYDLEVNPNAYFKVSGISQSIANIRNIVSVVYKDTSGLMHDYSYPDYGTATAGAASTLTDSSKVWTVDGYAGYNVTIISGLGIGQTRAISSNTATILTVGSNWTTNPDTTSRYIITHADDGYTSAQDTPYGYGRRFMRITEGATSQIDTELEARNMARCIYNDLSEPIAEVEIDMRYLWAAEVGDQYLFYADNIHYTSDQLLAVVGIKHSLSGNKYRTSLVCRGRPAGSHRQWLVRESRTGVAPANTTISTPTGLSLSTGTESVGSDTFSYILAEWDRNSEINLSSYSIRYRKTSTTEWAEVNGIRDTSIKITPLPGNVGYDIQIRAMNNRGIYSEWSATSTQTSQADTTAPSAPTISCVDTAKGFTVYSDGYTLPDDFSHFEIHVGKTSSFTVGGTDPVDWDGTSGSNTYHTKSSALPVIINNLIAGTVYYVKVKAVDTSGNKSASSSESTVYAGDAQRSDTLVVAASNASKASQLSADYVCDGTDDDIQINLALASLPVRYLFSDTATAGAPSTITLPSGASYIDDFYNGCVITLTGGTGSGQTRIISNYIASSGVATVSVAWGTQPNSTTTFEIYTYFGSVKLTEGDFVISDAIELPAFTSLSGVSKDVTKIICTDSTRNSNCMILNKNGFTAGGSFCKISNMTLDGNERNDTSAYDMFGIYLGGGCNNSFMDIVIVDCIQPAYIHYTDYSEFTNLFFGENGGYAEFNTCNYCKFNNIKVFGATGQGIFFAHSDYNVFDTIYSYKNGWAGIELEDVNWCNFINIYVMDNGRDGIYLTDCYYNKFSNGYILGNGTATDNTYYGIHFYSTSDSNWVVGMRIRARNTTTNDQKYGILIASGCDYNYIIHNDLYTSGQTGAISDSGTGTVTTLSGNLT